MDYKTYNRALLDILQVLYKNPELKSMPELEDWVEMGEMAYKSSPTTNMIYKKSGARLSQQADRIFARDASLLTGKDADWPEMFSAFIPKVIDMPAADRDYIWTKLAEALTALGHSPAPPSVAPTPTPTPTPAPAPPSAVPAPSLPPAKAALAKAMVPVANKAAAAAPRAYSEEEKRHLQFKQVIKENPGLRQTVRAVRSYVKKTGGSKEVASSTKADAKSEFEALMGQLKAGGVSAPTTSADGGMGGLFSSSLFSKLTGLLEKIASDAPAKTSVGPPKGPEVPKTAVQLQEEEETRKIVARLSMVQQFHSTFFKYYIALAEFRGGRFPQLVKGYNELKAYIAAVVKQPPEVYTLLKEVVQFFKQNKRAIRKHDARVFDQPTHPVLMAMKSGEIWRSLTTDDHREQFWNWVEEVRNIALAADICTGKTAPFEVIAKDILPTICSSAANSSASAGGAEGLLNRFVEAIEDPQRIQSFRQLIDNFEKDPSQVTQAVDLITAMLDDGEGDDDSEPETDATASTTTTTTPSVSGPKQKTE